MKKLITSHSETASFSVALAVTLKSTDLAILLQFFINSILHNKKLGLHFHDGRTWHACSRSSLTEYFPYWNEQVIKRRIASLVRLGILIVGNYNKENCDHTNSYALVDESRWGF